MPACFMFFPFTGKWKKPGWLLKRQQQNNNFAYNPEEQKFTKSNHLSHPATKSRFKLCVFLVTVALQVGS